MAILSGPLQLEGKVGGMIFYKRGNKTCCRAMPQYTPESMTAASKQSAREFGRASKAGKLLRDALNGIWRLQHDNTMVNRLNKALYTALRKDPAHKRGARIITPVALQETLKNFRFNNKANLPFQAQTIRKPGGHIQVVLPPDWLTVLKKPRYASHVQLQAAAIAIDLETGACRKVSAATECISIDLPGDTLTLNMQLQAPKAMPVIVMIQARFVMEETDGRLYPSAQKSCLQSCVVAVLLPEKVQQPENKGMKSIRSTGSAKFHPKQNNTLQKKKEEKTSLLHKTEHVAIAHSNAPARKTVSTRDDEKRRQHSRKNT
ncbi:hypothetical protein F0L74_28980 [Chitinophaga agrisoli]|uniref:Uncharacterized protein n=1 Tax=Chitinophaga agrisoli TaxID=2607653 RepID=A0A5B2VPJ9_9BACT|nr:hypothetical protein [Chitinophaga agrisoli]KAA2240202.1 hypothetical protein F0L74_28980 [Chitinophaga agrisoli]